MRLLLDSHILLRLDTDPGLVPQYQRDVLADRRHQVFVSAVTAWELGIKQSKGKLALTKPVSQQGVQFGFFELPITFAHAEFAARLPLLHGDPFDRMLVAQAMIEELTLVTADATIRKYGVACL